MSAANHESKDRNLPQYDFPPFPPIPEGVTIIPFEDFKEHGIAIYSQSETGEEVDGLGIPTVEIKAKHVDTDECKSDAAKFHQKRAQAKLAKKALGSAYKPGVSIWDQWEEAEEARWFAGKRDFPRPEDRFYHASRDFKRYRTWPPGTSDLGRSLANIWDQFRLFAGLISSTPLWTFSDPEKGRAEEDSGEADVEEDEAASDFEDTTQKVYRKRGRPRAPYQGFGEDPVLVTSEEQVSELFREEDDKRDIRAKEFIENPERKTAEFLSSYMRKQGLLWAPTNVKLVPRLVHFFIRYIYKTDVLTQTKGRASLERAIVVAETAIEELPLTSELSKVIPCSFSKACQLTFGTTSGCDFGEATSLSPEIPAETISTEILLSPATEEVHWDVSTSVHLPSTLNSDDRITTARPPEWSDSTSFTDNFSSINPPLHDKTQWAEMLDLEELGRSTGPAEQTFEWDIWGTEPEAKLITLMGPTLLPLTHRAGVVESGVRKVKSITLPLPASSRMEDGGPTAAGVETDLTSRFAQLLMQPWVGWDVGDEMEASSGTVLTGRSLLSLFLKPHDPLKDDIVVLVDPEVVKSVRVGMGIWGRWVQLVRISGVGAVKDKTPLARRNKAHTKRRTEPTTFWYMDTVICVCPSYHVPTVY